MAKSSKSAKFLVAYNKAVELTRKANAFGLQSLAASEATVREVLLLIPSDTQGSQHLEALRKDLFAMKDDIRKTKRTIQTLNGNIKKVGAALFDTSVDWKSIAASVKSQRRLVDAIFRDAEQLTAKREEVGRFINAAIKQAEKEERKSSPKSKRHD
jgi:septal ring factor EnvC (AmiA/AmiB activator)